MTASEEPVGHDAEPRDLYGAIEGGGSKFLCALFDGAREIQREARFSTRAPAETLAEVISFFAPYRARLCGVGLACFGPLELRASADNFGAMLRTPKPDWSEVPLRARLSAALGVSVAIDTDVNAAALAEQRWGAAQGCDPVVYVTVGTGVGVGVVAGGRALHGLMHPELGHLHVRGANGPGHCPFHGACVEGLVSAPAIRARTGLAPEMLPDDHPIWSSVAETLAQLLHASVLAYSPERIVLAGGVLERAGLRTRVQRALTSELANYVPRPELAWPAVQEYVVAPGLGARSGLFGALALALESST